MLRYVFVDTDGTVVQIISGVIDEQQQQQFLDDYEKLFKAVAILEVPDGVDVWIGGRYDDEAGFLPPAPQPQPEPLPEPTAEPLPEVEPGVEPVV